MNSQSAFNSRAKLKSGKKSEREKLILPNAERNLGADLKSLIKSASAAPFLPADFCAKTIALLKSEKSSLAFIFKIETPSKSPFPPSR